MARRRWKWTTRIRGHDPDGNPAEIHVRATVDDEIEIETTGPVRLSPRGAQRLRHKIGHAMAEVLRGARW